MSDAVLTALIAFGSAFVGAMAGVLGSIVTSKIQFKKQTFETLYAARLVAYQKLYEMYTIYLLNPNSAENVAAFFVALSQAQLVASEQTTICFLEMRNVLIKSKKGMPLDDHDNLIQKQFELCLQSDLRVMTTPKVK